MDDVISLFKVYMAKDVDEFVLPVLHSGYIGTGQKVWEFEERFDEFIGQSHNGTVAVNCCTSALFMALKMAGVGHNDLVISTPMTCLATNEAILHVGARILWCDIDPTTGNLDSGFLEKLIMENNALGNRVKAVVCVDWGGSPCDTIRFRAQLHTVQLGLKPIPIIEDAACAVGADSGIYKLGKDSGFVAYSFQAIKHLTTGDGGALLCSDVQRAKLMRWFGLDRSKGASMRCVQDPPELGYRFQMNDIAAAIGLANLRGLQDRLDIAARNADLYDLEFLGMDRVGVLDRNKHGKSSNWLYTLLVDYPESFISSMHDKGIQCSKVHARNDTKSIFKPFARRGLVGVDEFDQHHVCIPVGWWIDESRAKRIVNAVKEYESHG